MSSPSNPLSQFVLKCAVVVTPRVIAAMSADPGPPGGLARPAAAGAGSEPRTATVGVHWQGGQYPDR